MKIKTGDKVMVMSGKDRGKTGKVLQIFPKLRKASVEGVNLMFKHLRQKARGQAGQKVQFPALISMSNIMLLCPKCGKPTRAKSKIENKVKSLYCRRCKEII